MPMFPLRASVSASDPFMQVLVKSCWLASEVGIQPKAVRLSCIEPADGLAGGAASIPDADLVSSRELHGGGRGLCPSLPNQSSPHLPRLRPVQTGPREACFPPPTLRLPGSGKQRALLLSSQKGEGP